MIRLNYPWKIPSLPFICSSFFPVIVNIFIINMLIKYLLWTYHLCFTIFTVFHSQWFIYVSPFYLSRIIHTKQIFSSSCRSLIRSLSIAHAAASKLRNAANKVKWRRVYEVKFFQKVVTLRHGSFQEEGKKTGGNLLICTIRSKLVLLDIPCFVPRKIMYMVAWTFSILILRWLFCWLSCTWSEVYEMTL